MLIVESTYSRRKEAPKNFLDSIVGDTKRQVESKRVEAVVSAGSVEVDLRKALAERESTDVPVSISLDDRSFDLVLLSNWEDQIVYDAEFTFGSKPSVLENNLTTPANKALESGAWTQSIIWSPDAPFRDFTQLEFNHEDDIVPEDKTGKPTLFYYHVYTQYFLAEMARPRKRFRTDGGVRDKFNLSNDQFYEIHKDARHRVRQTFGQLSVEHAYPAQKLQLPFVSGFHCYLSTCLKSCHSTRHDCQRQKHVLSIALLFNFHRISNYASAKFALQRKRRTKQGDVWAKAEMSARVFTAQTILVYETQAISCYGNTQRSILLSYQISVWGAPLSTTTGKRTRRTTIYRR